MRLRSDVQPTTSGLSHPIDLAGPYGEFANGMPPPLCERRHYVSEKLTWYPNWGKRDASPLPQGHRADGQGPNCSLSTTASKGVGTLVMLVSRTAQPVKGTR